MGIQRHMQNDVKWSIFWYTPLFHLIKILRKLITYPIIQEETGARRRQSINRICQEKVLGYFPATYILKDKFHTNYCLTHIY